MDAPYICSWRFLLCRSYSLLTFLLCIFLSLAGDVNPRKEKYTPDYSLYHNLSSTGKEINRLVLGFPEYIKIDSGYISRNKLPQYVVHLTNFSTKGRTPSLLSTPKTKLLFSFGEHAREFFPVESVLYLLKNITNGIRQPIDTPEERFSKFVLSNLDIYIIAIANPDGRHLIEKTKNYCWRGTSVGVDLDRNFDWNFGGTGSSGNPTDEEYRGPSPHSEPECRAFLDLSSKHMFDVFISFHSGTRQIYIPFADSDSAKVKRVPENAAAQLELAGQLAKSTLQSFKYDVGYKLNEYPADGTIYDFMHGVKKVPFSLAVELWGEGDMNDKQCFDLFNPPSQKLEDSLKEVMPIFAELFSDMVRWKQEKKHQHYHYLEQPEFSVPRTYVIPLLTLSVLVLVIFHRHLPPSLNLRSFQRRRVVSLRSLSSTFAVGGVKLT